MIFMRERLKQAESFFRGHGGRLCKRQNSSVKSFANLNQSESGGWAKARARDRKHDNWTPQRSSRWEEVEMEHEIGKERDTSKDVPIQMSWTFKIFRMLNSPLPGISISLFPVPSYAKRAGRSPSVTRTKFRISSLFILPHYRPSAFLLLSFPKQLMAHYVPQFIFHRLHAECRWATLLYHIANIFISYCTVLFYDFIARF